MGTPQSLADLVWEKLEPLGWNRSVDEDDADAVDIWNEDSGSVFVDGNGGIVIILSATTSANVFSAISPVLQDWAAMVAQQELADDLGMYFVEEVA